jgi:hypothetical protein
VLLLRLDNEHEAGCCLTATQKQLFIGQNLKLLAVADMPDEQLIRRWEQAESQPAACSGKSNAKKACFTLLLV